MTKDTTSFIDDLADIPGLNDLSARSTTPRTARDADDDTDDARPAKADDRPTFPCESCGGTGRYKGVRIHQPAVECFACKGRGYFFTSYKDRLAARAKAANRKQQRITHGLELFEETHPGLLADMRKHASWNEFLRDLVAKLDQGLDLSDRALEAAQRTVDRARAREQDRAREQLSRLANAATIDAAPLKAAFDAASRNGLKRPVLRYNGFEVSRAPDHGKNAGVLYVKAGDTYLGKITSDRYLPTREAEQIGIVARVIEAMQDPLTLAIAYGRRTGRCSCCGRKLTDPSSVERGIGPICASKFAW